MVAASFSKSTGGNGEGDGRAARSNAWPSTVNLSGPLRESQQCWFQDAVYGAACQAVTLLNVQESAKPPLDEIAERSFGLAMRAGRKRLRMSQTALAQELERRYGIRLDGTAITRIERRIHGNEGARAIRLGEAVAIAAILELSLDDLVAPGLDQQLRDARLRTEAADAQVRTARDAADLAHEHLRALEQAAARHTRQAELEAELSALQDEIYDLQAEIERGRSAEDPDRHGALTDRLLEMTNEETRLAGELKDFAATL